MEGSGHAARDTITFLEQETPDFIPSTLWPPNSQDLNTVNLQHLNCAAGEVYHSWRNSKTCMSSLINEWAQLNQSIVDAAVGQWCKYKFGLVERGLQIVQRH